MPKGGEYRIRREMKNEAQSKPKCFIEISFLYKINKKKFTYFGCKGRAWQKKEHVLVRYENS